MTTSGPPVSTWTPERVDTLRRLVASGRSASQIARDMGGGLTRNAVISKIHRMDIEMRRLPGRNKGDYRAPVVKPPRPREQNTVLARINAKKAKAATTPRPPARAVKEPPAPPQDRQVPLLELRDGATCKFPIGDPQDAQFHFCGAPPKTPDNRYCEYHHAICYHPVRPAPRDKAYA